MSGHENSIRLNDDNWIEWSEWIEGVLMKDDLDLYLVEQIDTEGKKKTLATAEERKAKKTKGTLRMYMTEKYLNITSHCSTPHELWSALKSHFQAASKNATAINIEKLVKLIKSPPRVQDLALHIRSIASKIGLVHVNSETFMTNVYSALLPKELTDLRLLTLRTTTSLTLADACDIVKNELASKGDKSLVAAQTNNKTKKFEPRKNDSELKKEDSDKICSYCARRGHTTENCYTKARADKLVTASKSDEPTVKSKITAIKHKVCAVKRKTKDSRWLLDSGSQSHTVPEDDGFESIDRNHNVELESAGGDDIRVEGVGSYHVQTRDDLFLTLQNCIYAPDLIANFLSTGKLNEAGMDVLLRKDGRALVYDDDGIVVTGKLVNGMYEMNMGEHFRKDNVNIIAATTFKKRTITEWHKALNHLNFVDLRKLLDNIGVKNQDQIPECKTCLLAKSTRTSFKPKQITTFETLKLVHSDLSGIIRAPACQNNNYFLTFTDDFSRYTFVYLLRSKEEVHEKFAQYKSLVENQQNRKIKVFRSDNGTEYTSRQFQSLIVESGIHHSFTNTDTPEQNGVSERLNRTIANGVRCALIDSGLPTRYWPYAVEYFVQTKNASPHAALNHQIPYTLWHSRTPEYDMFHPFGCTAVAYNANAEGKWSPRGIECRLLMLSRQKKGYVLLKMDNNEIFESCHVKFLEDDQRQQDNEAMERDELIYFDCDDPCNMQVQNENTPQERMDMQTDANEETDSFSRQEIDAVRMEPQVEEPNDPAADSREEDDGDDRCEGHPENETNDNGVFMSRTELARFKKDNPETNIRAVPGPLKSVRNGSGRPSKIQKYIISYINPVQVVKDALNGPEAVKWREALDNEYQALIKNGTWILTEPPKDARVIKTKWVLTKKNEDGVRYKARLVARGFAQGNELSVNDTFAPVIRGSSIKMLLSYALKNDLEVHHIDVKNAYLNAPIKEEIYVEQPFGYENKFKRTFACKLNKAMYGLKQAAKCWNDMLTRIMTDLGLRQFESEECIYATKGNELIVGAYVDDLLIISSSKQAIANFKKSFIDKVPITDKGEISKFVGIEVARLEGAFEMSQQTLIGELVDSHGLTHANGCRTPFPTGTVLDIDENDQQYEDIKFYQSTVGSLMYIAGCTRPDIQFAANQLGKYMSNPMIKHIRAAKRVVRYLKQTADAKLIFRKHIHDDIVIYADADFGNGEDSISTTGVTVFYAGNMVSWTSVKQQLVAMSSCEAELNAIREGAADAIYFGELLKELLGDETTRTSLVNNDNQPTLDIVGAGGKHQRTKHYKRRVNFVKQLVNLGTIKHAHRPTTEMLADAYTKPLPEDQLYYLMQKCGLHFGHKT